MKLISVKAMPAEGDERVLINPLGVDYMRKVQREDGDGFHFFIFMRSNVQFEVSYLAWITVRDAIEGSRHITVKGSYNETTRN